MTVDPGRLPTARLEPCQLIVANGHVRRTVDRNLVVVEQHDQFAELQMSRHGDRFVTDPLHQATVTCENVCVMVDDVIAKARRQHSFSERHADSVGNPLTQRSCRGFDPAGMSIFRMAGGSAAELAEISNLLDIHILVSREVE